ncbi:MAG TPA: class I SAM-dependent methyltransferase [Clostridiales bacterium]|nr:class I SAM-dependent methyltransferase [Clostridiales bacterium]
MISFDKISRYTDSLIDLKPDETDEIYAFLSGKKHPVVKKDVARFLAQTVMIKKPETILEIGTNVGYSSIVMALKMKKGKIYSIDYRADHHKKAKDNFLRYGVDEKIELLTGYAQDILPGLKMTFDIIFIDADKKGYSDYLDYAAAHINENGIILIDNLFWKGSVIEPPDTPDERNISGSLTDLNIKFSKLKGFSAQILSIGDGLGFAVKEG